MNPARLFIAITTLLLPAVSPAQQNIAESNAQKVVVDLIDGSRVQGTLPAATTFPVQSGALQVPTAHKRIDSISMSADHKSATVIFLNGDRDQSQPGSVQLPLTTLLGTVALDMRVVKTLVVIPSPADAGSTDGLVFSNTLASDADLAHSAVGPPVKPYTDAKNGYNAPGEHEFVLGDHGRAVTIKGAYQNGDFVHILELDALDKIINPEQGTIEFWYCQKAQPLDDSYGVYRMFDGEAGLGGCIGLFAARNTLFFNIICGGQSRGITCPISVIPNDQWVHIAVVWNRKGIEGTDETMRLCINGTKVAASTSNDWGTLPGGRADICGGQNADCAGKYLMCDLKVWTRAVPQSPPPGQSAWQPPSNSAATASTPPPSAGPTPPHLPVRLRPHSACPAGNPFICQN